MYPDWCSSAVGFTRGQYPQCPAQDLAAQGQAESPGDLDAPRAEVQHAGDRYHAKYPKATNKLRADRDILLALFAFPAGGSSNSWGYRQVGKWGNSAVE